MWLYHKWTHLVTTQQVKRVEDTKDFVQQLQILQLTNNFVLHCKALIQSILQAALSIAYFVHNPIQEQILCIYQ